MTDDVICAICGLAYRHITGYKIWCERRHQLELVKGDRIFWAGRYWSRFFTLTDRQWAIAMIEAKLCHTEAGKHGYVPAHGCRMEDALWAHRIGAPGEVGFCECVAGVPWKSNEGSYRKPDLLNRFGVRTPSQSHYRLWVFDEDDDDWVMVLILPTGGYREYRVEGWLYAREAKVLLPNGKRKYWEEVRKDRPPAYYVPTCILHDWKLLPKMIEESLDLAKTKLKS